MYGVQAKQIRLTAANWTKHIMTVSAVQRI